MKLLSFGEEEIEEEESTPVRQFKSKSSHDLANDPTLSAVPAVESEEKASADEAKRKYCWIATKSFGFKKMFDYIFGFL